jgi:hypothetical protein
MAIEGRGTRQPFHLRWTLTLVAAIATAFALSRPPSVPPSTPEQMPSELLAAITRSEPGFQISAYDAPLLGRRAALWVGRGYLAEPEGRELLALADQGIERVEIYLARTVEDEYGRGARVHYFARGGAFISHTLGGYEQRRVRQPVILLSFAHERRAPYVHEAVHVLAPDWSALWLREGLAVLLNRRLSHSPMLMRLGGREIDLDARESAAQVRACLATRAGQVAWGLVGEDGIPEFADRDVRTSFYVLSGTLVEIYRSSRPTTTVSRLTGRSIEDWKEAMAQALRTGK